jgi:uracil-DNA glycosylase
MLFESLSSCRRCAEAGYQICSTPIFSGDPGAVFLTVGQAPGRHEAEVSHLPFSGPAGKRLFRWLATAGFDEAEFRATQAMTAITKCYPGPHPTGRGDRVPSRQEQALCAPGSKKSSCHKPRADPHQGLRSGAWTDPRPALSAAV